MFRDALRLIPGVDAGIGEIEDSYNSPSIGTALGVGVRGGIQAASPLISDVINGLTDDFMSLPSTTTRREGIMQMAGLLAKFFALTTSAMAVPGALAGAYLSGVGEQMLIKGGHAAGEEIRMRTFRYRH